MAFFVLHRLGAGFYSVANAFLAGFIPAHGWEDSAKFSDKGRNHIGKFDKLFDGKLLGSQVENRIRTNGTVVANKWFE